MAMICSEFGGVSRVAAPHLQPIRIDPNSIDRSSEYLKRIPENEWQEFLHQMQGVGRRPLLQELEAFQLGQWNHPVFLEPNWCYSAFHAYLKGRLDENGMNKLFLYKACSDQTKELNKKFEKHQLRNDDGTLNEEAFDLLEKSIRRCECFTERDLERIGEMLATLRPDQTQFFIIGNKNDLFQRVATSIGFCTLDPYTQVVLPPDLAYKILQVKCGKNTMAPRCVLGFWDEELFSNPSERIICIPSFFKLPKHLQGLEASPLAIYYHDIAYHLLIESANPCRDIWVQFLRFLLQESLNPKRLICKSLIAKVSDRDFLMLVKNRLHFLEENFWACLTTLLPRDANNFLILFAEFYKKNRQNLERYGLTIKSLQRAHSAMFFDGRFPKEDIHFLTNLEEYLTRECPNSSQM